MINTDKGNIDYPNDRINGSYSNSPNVSGENTNNSDQALIHIANESDSTLTSANAINQLTIDDVSNKDLVHLNAESIDTSTESNTVDNQTLNNNHNRLVQLTTEPTEPNTDILGNALIDQNSTINTGKESVKEFVDRHTKEDANKSDTYDANREKNLINQSVYDETNDLQTTALSENKWSDVYLSPVSETYSSSRYDYDTTAENLRLEKEDLRSNAKMAINSYLRSERLSDFKNDQSNIPDDIQPSGGITLDPSMHQLTPESIAAVSATRSNSVGKNGEYLYAKRDHFAFDPNDDLSKYQTDGKKKFAGSGSPLYTNAEEGAKRIAEMGVVYNELVEHGGKRPRALSAIDAFTRLDDPRDARYATMFAYNRTRLPIADLEWRKGFRHVFITRPECFILGSNNQLSEQCQADETFYTAYTRAPHILYLLSPSYITCTDPNNPRYKDNFNYLLSNRLMTFKTTGIELSTVSGVQKSIIGSTITPGSWITSDFSSELSLTFRETKFLDVYECIRLWIRYINKIYSGQFASSYSAEYNIHNSFGTYMPSDTSMKGAYTAIGDKRHLHPYDRALDYCCTIFDIVTNEAGTKILYWCKYIGAYPTGASLEGLTDNANAAITGDQTCVAKFIYQGKEEYKNKSLIEFNYNAGIVNENGVPNNCSRTFSLPYLLRDNYNPGHGIPSTAYNGAAGMFTGRPYIALTREKSVMPYADPTTEDDKVIMAPNQVLIPQLRFLTLEDITANLMNSGITNDATEIANNLEKAAMAGAGIEDTGTAPFEPKMGIYDNESSDEVWVT